MARLHATFVLFVTLVACGGPTSPAAVRALPPCEAGPVSFTRAPSGAREVGTDWLAEHRCRVRIVDVRDREELEGELGRIEGATWAPLPRLEELAASWRTEAPIVVVDRSGRRAARAQAMLEARGFILDFAPTRFVFGTALAGASLFVSSASLFM